MQEDNGIKAARDFLQSQGAYDYMNHGNIQRDDKVYLMVSQEYWDAIVNNPRNDALQRKDAVKWINENKPLLLVVKDKRNKNRMQIVGVYRSDLDNRLADAGQERLHDRALEDAGIPKNATVVGTGAMDTGSQNNFVYRKSYLKVESLAQNYDSTPIDYGDEKNLKSALSDEDIKNAKLGVDIGKSSPLQTNDGISVPRVDNVNTGFTYFLIPDRDGNKSDGRIYTRVPLKYKDLKDTDYKNRGKKLFDKLHYILEEALKLPGNERGKFDLFYLDLSSILFVGEKPKIGLHLRQDGIQITKDGKIVKVSENKDEILDALADLGVRVNVFAKDVNTRWHLDKRENYNDVIIDADVLTTNMNSTRKQGRFFFMYERGVFNSTEPEAKESEESVATAPETKSVLGTSVHVDATFETPESVKELQADDQSLVVKAEALGERQEAKTGYVEYVDYLNDGDYVVVGNANTIEDNGLVEGLLEDKLNEGKFTFAIIKNRKTGKYGLVPTELGKKQIQHNADYATGTNVQRFENYREEGVNVIDMGEIQFDAVLGRYKVLTKPRIHIGNYNRILEEMNRTNDNKNVQFVADTFADSKSVSVVSINPAEIIDDTGKAIDLRDTRELTK
ncbi:MAG: hypothetical protein LBE56_12825 [Tannerella sp.]|jgi:hypothetical protein|nr:hypothetical protein [Tannerella sp.]